MVIEFMLCINAKVHRDVIAVYDMIAIRRGGLWRWHDALHAPRTLRSSLELAAASMRAVGLHVTAMPTTRRELRIWPGLHPHSTRAYAEQRPEEHRREHRREHHKMIIRGIASRSQSYEHVHRIGTRFRPVMYMRTLVLAACCSVMVDRWACNLWVHSWPRTLQGMHPCIHGRVDAAREIG